MIKNLNFKTRFRGFLPVVIDVETGGFNPQKDALLELAAVFLKFDEESKLKPIHTEHFHIQAFMGANIEQASLDFLGLDPTHPFRYAIEEKAAMLELCQKVQKSLKENDCKKAVLVGHNPTFDLSFIQAAFKRCNIKHSPFHLFTTFDTATLAALAYGQTILAKAVKAANIEFDENEAHSAIYDAEKTAELFCKIINNYKYPN